jgi:tripartite-type tricarboxylate transporter receptor subunit TctC
MKGPRRRFLHLAASAAALPAISRIARAQTYPARPVRLIVGFPAGGSVDLIARLMAQWLSETLGQPFVVQDRPGAAGNLATEAIVRANPNGYALGMVTTANTSSLTFYDKLNFNIVRDIAPIASICRVPFVMVVNQSFPAKTVPAFIAYARSNPGEINMGSAGNGTPSHIAGELFKAMARINMIHVPYRGEPPALADLIGGRVQVIFGSLPAFISQIRAGKLRALGVATASPVEALPHVPTISEFVHGYEVAASAGIGSPKNTPAVIIDKLNATINAGLVEPSVKAQLADLGAPTLALSPADYGNLISDEVENWRKYARDAGIKVE